MDVLSESLLDVLRHSGLTEKQAEAIFEQGREAVVFALLELAEQKAGVAAESHQTPATPSSMKPPYQKPNKSRGRKKGHPGSHRPTPERIDWQVEHRADHCPDCGSRLKRCAETRTRYTEEIPEIEPEVTEHTIHRDWCPKCKKKVEPTVTDGGSRSSGIGWRRCSIRGTSRFRPRRSTRARCTPTKRVGASAAKRTGVVFCDRHAYLFYDRPIARFAGAEKVFHQRIRRHVGHRFLGSRLVCCRAWEILFLSAAICGIRVSRFAFCFSSETQISPMIAEVPSW